MKEGERYLILREERPRSPAARSMEKGKVLTSIGTMKVHLSEGKRRR